MWRYFCLGKLVKWLRYKPFKTTVRQRGRGGGCGGIIPFVVKKKAVAKARLWPCTQMPSFLAVPSLRRQKASMTTTKYFPWRDRVGSHMKMGITKLVSILCTTTHMPTLTEYMCSEVRLSIFRSYFFCKIFEITFCLAILITELSYIKVLPMTW